MKYGMAFAGLLLAGCSSLPDWVARARTVEVSELARSSQCATPGTEPQLNYLPDLAALRSWEQSRGIELAQGLQPQGPFVVVEMGERPSAGHGLAISRVAELRGDRLVLHATFVAPRAEDVAAQVLTTPCVLVSLPARGYARIELEDQDGRSRAQSAGGGA